MRFYLLNITILPALGLVLLLTIFWPSLVLAECCQTSQKCFSVSKADCDTIPGTHYPDKECIGVYCQTRYSNNTMGCCAYAGDNNVPTCEQITAEQCYQYDVYASQFFANQTCQNNQCVTAAGGVATPAGSSDFQPQVPIPGMKLTPGQLIASYIVGIYRYGIWLAGGLAVIMIMVGGLMWMLAGGNPSRVEAAKGRIGAAITGLGLALVSYLILVGINPKLVSLNLASITPTSQKDPFNQNVDECAAKGGWTIEGTLANQTPEILSQIKSQKTSTCRQICSAQTGTVQIKDFIEMNMTDANGKVIGINYCCVCTMSYREAGQKQCREAGGDEKTIVASSGQSLEQAAQSSCNNWCSSYQKTVNTYFQIDGINYCCVCND